MATTMYAWTDIKNGDKVVKAGDKVTKGSFDEDDWDQLVEARSVRPQKYPDMPKSFSGSPREFMVKEVTRQLELAEDVLGDEDILAVNREVDAEVELENENAEDE